MCGVAKYEDKNQASLRVSLWVCVWMWTEFICRFHLFFFFDVTPNFPHIPAISTPPIQPHPTQPNTAPSFTSTQSQLFVFGWWQWFCCWLLLLWQTSIVQHLDECQPLKRHNCDNRQSTIVFCVCMCAGFAQSAQINHHHHHYELHKRQILCVYVYIEMPRVSVAVCAAVYWSE